MAGTVYVITVVHLKRHPDCYRVDRASALGNPFDLGSEDQRPIVVRAHKEYTWLVVGHGMEPIEAARAILSRYPELTLARAWKRPTRAEFMEALAELEAVARRGDCAIGCWCAPRECHGDNYRDYLVWKLKG